MGNDQAQQYHGGGQGVGSGVGGGGRQSVGLDALSQRAVKPPHPQLHRHSAGQDARGEGGQLRFLRVKDLANRAFPQLHSHQ